MSWEFFMVTWLQENWYLLGERGELLGPEEEDGLLL